MPDPGTVTKPPEAPTFDPTDPYAKLLNSIETKLGNWEEDRKKLQQENIDLQTEVAKRDMQINELSGRIERIQANLPPLRSRAIALGGSIDWPNEWKAEFVKWAYGMPFRKSQIAAGVKANEPLAETDTGFGEELVPTKFVPEILRLSQPLSVVMQEARTVPMLSYKYVWPTMDGSAVTMLWPVTEKTALAQQVIATDDLEIEAKRMGGFMYITNDLLDDTNAVGLAVMDVILEIFTEAIAKTVDMTAFQGTLAAGSYPYFNGLTVDTGIDEYDLDTGDDTFAEITALDIRTLISRVAKHHRAGSKFYYSGLCAVYMDTLEDTSGRMVYRQPAGDKPALLYGYPQVETETMPDTEASEDATAMVFGNMKKGLIYGINKDIRIESTRILKLLENMTTLVVELKVAMGFAHKGVFSRMQFHVT